MAQHTGLQQVQRLSLQQTLSPQLQQSLHLLQVPALELNQLVHEELQQNPLLEELPKDEPPRLEVESDKKTETGDVEFDKEFETLAKIDDDWRENYRQTLRRYPVAGLQVPAAISFEVAFLPAFILRPNPGGRLARLLRPLPLPVFRLLSPVVFCPLRRAQLVLVKLAVQYLPSARHSLNPAPIVGRRPALRVWTLKPVQRPPAVLRAHARRQAQEPLRASNEVVPVLKGQHRNPDDPSLVVLVPNRACNDLTEQLGVCHAPSVIHP